MSTGGSAVIRKPGSAWLEGTPAMDHRKNGKRRHMQSRWKRKIDIGAGLCGYMFRYTYAGIREMKMQMEKEVGHMSCYVYTFVCLFVCLGFEDPSNHWTKRMANTQLTI